MDSGNSLGDLDSRKAYKQPIGPTERSVHFWGEARGESRKISVARLKCAAHSDAAESLALTIWERMEPEQYRILSEIDKLLMTHEEIRVATLRETLGRIFEAVNVDVKDLRTIHHVPIEALTLLLNHVMKIYNTMDFDLEADSFVPVSTRIEQMVTKAKELGLGHIEISKNMYVSERAKLAMLEKQIMGRLKLKSLKNEKSQDMDFKLKKETNKFDTIKRLKKAIAIKEKLKMAQRVQVSKSKCNLKKGRSSLSRSYNSSSTVLAHPSGSLEGLNEADPCNEDENSKDASIDTSSWVISPTHEYYFGSTPPVIPTTTVTHEVYPKPVDSKMVDREDQNELSQNVAEARRKESENQIILLDDATYIKSEDTDLTTLTTASSSQSLSTHEEFNFEESHGDASTIFAWTEPEKSNSFCLGTYEKNVEADEQTESEAAGDGCELARTKEESSITTLAEEQEDVQSPSPPTEFGVLDTDSSFISGTSSGLIRKNLFSCKEAQSHTVTRSVSSAKDNEHEVEKNENEESECSVTEGNVEARIGNAQSAGLSSDEQVPEKDTEEDQPETAAEQYVTQDSTQEHSDILKETPTSSSPAKQMAQSILEELTAEIMRRSTKEAIDVVATASGVFHEEKEFNTADLKGEGIEVAAKDAPNEVESEPSCILKTEETHAVVPPPPPPYDGQLERVAAANTIKTAPPHKSVDEFKSAHDFRGGTQILYLRPTYHRPRLEKPKSPRGPDIPGEEDESSSSQTQGAGGSSPPCGKRNDRRTLAVLAFALGLGTLGYMTFSGSGSGGALPEMLGVAGGRAMNIIESKHYRGSQV